MLYYPYKTMFSAYKSVIVSPCACDLFVSKVTKITRYMDVRFWRSFFGAFSVCDDCILKSTKAWLLKLSVLYIHSFMQVHSTTFQIKTVFNNVLFSTEVHNPLHAHLLALSHIYSPSKPLCKYKKTCIYIYTLFFYICKVIGFEGGLTWQKVYMYVRRVLKCAVAYNSV